MILEIPELKDVIKGELAKNGDWVVANIDTQMSWPLRSQKVRYRGLELWVLPIMKDHYPGVALNRLGGISLEDAERLIMGFLSAVSWIEGGGILLEYFTGGNLPRTTGRRQKSGFVIQDDFDFSYLPEPADEKAQLALALMREGRGLNHPAYAFLSFFRVLEVALPAKKRREWITAHLDIFRDHRAKEALAKLRANGINDIGTHLHKSGRHAIAHAHSNPIINPDDPADMRRLRFELPIMSALAELAIEKELGVETRHTVWEKHLYELEGFKKVLGPELIDLIEKGEQLGAERVVEIPALSVELRKHEPYGPLTNLQPVFLDQNSSSVTLLIESVDKCFGFRCRLDFAAERIHFDIENDLQVKDDQTAACADAIAEICRFVRDYWCNGELRILNSDTGELISRKDAFIPRNCTINVDACNANIEHWKTAACKRRDKAESGQ